MGLRKPRINFYLMIIVICLCAGSAFSIFMYKYTAAANEEVVNNILNSESIFDIIDEDEELSRLIKEAGLDDKGNGSRMSIQAVMPMIFKSVESGSFSEQSKNKLSAAGLTENQIDKVEKIALKLSQNNELKNMEYINPIERVNKILIVVLSLLIVLSGFLFVRKF